MAHRIPNDANTDAPSLSDADLSPERMDRFIENTIGHLNHTRDRMTLRPTIEGWVAEPHPIRRNVKRYLTKVYLAYPHIGEGTVVVPEKYANIRVDEDNLGHIDEEEEGGYLPRFNRRGR